MIPNITDALAAYRQGGGLASSTDTASSDKAGSSGSFGDMLKNFAGDTVQSLEGSEKAAAAGAVGKADLASVVTAISKAELMLQTVVTIRDKVISAYTDITKTSI